MKKYINEEVNKYVNKLNVESPEKVLNVINELFNMSIDRFMSNIGSVEADGKNYVASENWDIFIDNLTQSIAEQKDIWNIGIRNIKLKILTYKYFTRKEMVKKEALEGYLRTEIKTYFTALQNFVDTQDFVMKFFQLPSNILYALVRYLFFMSPELNKSIKVTNDNLRDNINRVIGKRMEVAEKIAKISNGYADLFDVQEIKDLYDNGVLFEDNFVNRAINEFVCKLTQHKKAKNSMIEMYSGSMVTDINRMAEETAAYVAHVAAVRSEEGYEYFSANGEQIGTRFDNELQLIKDGKYDGYVVDKHSRLKEPNERINTGVMPWETNMGGEEGLDGSAGGPGASSGGGGAAGGTSFSGNFGNADFGGDFAPPGEEGIVPGSEEPDGTPMPDDEDGMPMDFGTEEDNTGEEVGAPPKDDGEEK